MALNDQIRIMCAYLGISQSELAEKAGMSKQNLNNKINRKTLTPEEIRQLVESVGCSYKTKIVLPDGREIE